MNDYKENEKFDIAEEIDDELVMHFVSLLMNPNFINSPYKDFDFRIQPLSLSGVLFRFFSKVLFLFRQFSFQP